MVASIFSPLLIFPSSLNLRPELPEHSKSAANKPTLVLAMRAALIVSAVGFFSMSEATEPSLPQFIRYSVVIPGYFLDAVNVGPLIVTLIKLSVPMCL